MWTAAASLGDFAAVAPTVAVDPDLSGERSYFYCRGLPEQCVADPAGFGHG